MTTRRDFLFHSAALAAFATLPKSPRVTARPTRIERPGLQLYTLNAEMTKDAAGTIAAVAAIGYTEVEFAYYFGNAPELLRDALHASKLVAPSAHADLDALEQRWSVSEHAAKILGHDTLVVPSLDRRKFTTVADWKALARRFNALGQRAHDAGLRFAYHNHDFEFLPIDGTRPYDVLLGDTDAALVDFELDLYWITKGGGDPLAYFAKYPGRFPIVHVKDTTGAPTFPMLDPGAGTIDFKHIFAQWNRAGIRHYYAEVDNPTNAKATMMASYRYLRDIEF
ncbi:MAG: sugar phosphate isomerase/epimerase [Gemmatimonas sp.]